MAAAKGNAWQYLEGKSQKAIVKKLGGIFVEAAGEEFSYEHKARFGSTVTGCSGLEELKGLGDTPREAVHGLFRDLSNAGNRGNNTIVIAQPDTAPAIFRVYSNGRDIKLELIPMQS